MKSLLEKLFKKPVVVYIRNLDIKMVRAYIARGFSVVSRVIGGVAVWVATK
jgi:hypothetical protein